MRGPIRLVVAATVAVVCATSPAPAVAAPHAEVVQGDGIGAVVETDPWRLRILDGHGRELLGETGARNLFGGLSYSQGVRVAGILPFLETGYSWDADFVTHRATRVEAVDPVPGGLRFTVGTTEWRSPRKFVVAVTTASPRRLRVEVSLTSMSGVSRLRAAFAARPGEHYQGFGQHFGPGIDARGQEFAIGAGRQFRTPELGGIPIPLPDYGSIPWFVSSSGYGVAVWNQGNGVRFDMASRAAAVTWSVPVRSGPLAFDVFAGDAVSVLADYTAAVGRPQVLPEWHYGVWRGADRYDDTAAALADRDRFRDLGLPLDVQVLDSPWETHYNSWVPNPVQWGDFPALLASLERGGVKPVVWITGWQNVDSTEGDVLADPQSRAWAAEPAPPFADLDAAGLLVRNADGTPFLFDWWMGRGASVDFTTAAGREAWRDLAAPTIRLGVRGVKTDGMEGFYFGDGVRFGDGRNGAQAAWANLLGYRLATMDALTAANGDDWTLIGRSATHGAQGLGATWPGDQWSTVAGLHEAVRAGLNGSMSGFSNFLADVGGYFGRPPTLADILGRLGTGWRPDGVEALFSGFPPRPEVLVRWAQVGAVMPSFLYFSKAAAQPWRYDAATFAAVRDALVLHETLVPVLHAAAVTARETGMPIWRPLSLVHGGLDRAWVTWDEWMVGEDLLVAPVLTEGARSRTVWLPPGDWVDFWSGQTLSGDREIVVDAPLPRLPMFVRAGAVVATYPADVTTLSASPDDSRAVGPGGRLDVTVWPGGEGEASFRLASGATLAAPGNRLTWTGDVGTSLLVVLPAGSPPTQVTAGGEPLPSSDCVTVRTTRSGWCHDPARATVVAGVPATSGEVTLVS